MQEFFFTILSIWLIWKLFNAFSGKESTTRTYSQTNTHHHYHSQKQAEGNVRVETKKQPTSRIPNDEGEYVDYEEVK